MGIARELASRLDLTVKLKSTSETPAPTGPPNPGAKPTAREMLSPPILPAKTTVVYRVPPGTKANGEEGNGA